VNCPAKFRERLGVLFRVVRLLVGIDALGALVALAVDLLAAQLAIDRVEQRAHVRGRFAARVGAVVT
jgi:hypothetical protein